MRCCREWCRRSPRIAGALRSRRTSPREALTGSSHATRDACIQGGGESGLVEVQLFDQAPNRCGREVGRGRVRASKSSGVRLLTKAVRGAKLIGFGWRPGPVEVRRPGIPCFLCVTDRFRRSSKSLEDRFLTFALSLHEWQATRFSGRSRRLRTGKFSARTSACTDQPTGAESGCNRPIFDIPPETTGSLPVRLDRYIQRAANFECFDTRVDSCSLLCFNLTDYQPKAAMGKPNGV